MILQFQSALFAIIFFASLIFGAHNPKELNVVFRQIGHRVLESMGDSISRVLPVETKKENTFIISFDTPLHFSSDSLYKIIDFELSRIGVMDFVAELKECNSDKVFLAILHSESMDSITPCNGRELPTGCYTIEITMLKKGRNNWLLLILAFPIFILLSYFYFRSYGRKSGYENREIQSLTIGSYLYDARNNQLKHKVQNETLTEKEAKLLSLLLDGYNEIQNRNFLMNEIWADEGILVVSKNLDVLVSKLRKKLRHDENIRITNVHGVGYKLEIQ